MGQFRRNAVTFGDVSVSCFAPLQGLGRISYSLYLLHQATLGIVFAVALGGAPRITSLTDFGLALLAFLVTLGTAWIMWIAFERRLVQFGHACRYRST